MPVVCPQRITPELVTMLKKYQPLYFNTHFNHPKEFTPESKQACDMLADAGIPLGNQTVLMRGINDCANVMKKLVAQAGRSTASSPTTTTSATSPRAPPTSAPAWPRASRSTRACAATPPASRVPTYIIDAIGGGGKTPVFPNYVISQAPGQVILRNYEGVISKYTEPEDYVEGECHCEDCEAETRASRRGRHVRPTTARR